MEPTYKYLPFQYDELTTRRAKEYLEQKALEGYEFVKLKGIMGSLGWAKFKVIEPQKIIYRVEVFESRYSDYESSYEAIGWKLVADNHGYVRIFKWDREEEPMPEERDLQEEKRLVFDAYAKTQGILAAGYLFYILIFTKLMEWDYTILLYSWGVAVVVIMPMLIAMIASIIIRFIAYRKRMDRELKGEEVRYSSMKRAAIVSTTCIISLQMMLLLIIIMEILIGNRWKWIGTIAMISGSYYCGYLVNKVLKMKDKKSKKNKVAKIAIIGSIGVIGVFVVTMIMTLRSFDVVGSGQKDITRYPVISIGNMENLGQTSYTNQILIKSTSIFVPKGYDYSEYLKDGRAVWTIYYRAIHPKIAQSIYEGEFIKHVEQSERNGENIQDRLVFVEGDSSTSREIIYDKEDNMLFIRDDKKVVILEGDIDFTEDRYKKEIEEILEST
ncbi:MAG: DUF2812 domain-containing protein [Cellulosilyticaceae bacterium]